MANGNPFMVTPGGDISGGLRQLGGSIQQLGEQQREQEAQERARARMQGLYTGYQEAMQSEDPAAAIADLSMKYPEFQQQAMQAFGITNERTGNAAVEAYGRALNDPQNARQYLTEGIEKVRRLGGNPQTMMRDLEMYDRNPEGALRLFDQGYARVAPRSHKAFREMQVKQQLDKKPFQYKDGVIFDPNTGETKRAEVQPEGKAPKLKEVKGGVKYFEDGSEQPIGTNESVQNPVTGKKFTPAQADAILADAKEFQLKNGGFAVTLDEGMNTIDRMYSEGYNPTTAAWTEAAFGSGVVSNLIRTPEDQVFMGSIDQMINAIARRETGAAITEFERKDFFNRYMPAPGDSKKRMKQKRDALDRQRKSIAGQSGGVFEALKIVGADEAVPELQKQPSQVMQEAQQPQATQQSIVIKSHPQYGDISESDIQETMRANGMTREQVLQRLGGG